MREGSQNMHWPRPSLWRDFQGINGLKIQGFFETSKVLWNVLAYFKEKFERQFRITAKWRFHPCSCSLFTYFSDWNPFNSGFSNFIPKDLFPMQNNQFDSPPPEKQWSKRTPCQCKILPFMSGCYWYRPLQETVKQQLYLSARQYN